METECPLNLNGAYTVYRTPSSRVSFACIQHSETAQSACNALLATLGYFRTLGVAFRRVMTDNGIC